MVVPLLSSITHSLGRFRYTLWAILLNVGAGSVLDPARNLTGMARPPTLCFVPRSGPPFGPVLAEETFEEVPVPLLVAQDVYGSESLFDRDSDRPSSVSFVKTGSG